MKTKLYVSGPMSGRENYNQEAFEEAATVLKQLGYHPVTPFDLDTVEPVAYHEWIPNMKRDIKYLVTMDGVLVIDGWEDSKGATLEVAIANKLEIPIYRLDDDGFLNEVRINTTVDTYEYTPEVWENN